MKKNIYIFIFLLPSCIQRMEITVQREYNKEEKKYILLLFFDVEQKKNIVHVAWHLRL
jgi:hypothetical protein